MKKILLPVLCISLLLSQFSWAEDLGLVMSVTRTRFLPRTVTPAHRSSLDDVVGYLRSGKTAEANRSWSLFVKTYVNSQTERDVDSVIRWVLRESYLKDRPDIRSLAERLNSVQDAEKAIRYEIADIRDKLSEGHFPVEVQPLKVSADGTVSWGEMVVMGKDQAKAYLEDLQAMLETMGDDSQMTQLNLENAMSKQNKMLQTMSTMMKQMHDTLRAIIQNMRG